MKAMTLRLPDGVYERLRQEAFDKRVSITSLIIGALAVPEPTGDPHRRVLTSEEFAAMLEAYKDPKYLAALAEDFKREGMVEVDNPLRREVRPRRGTERATPTESGENQE